jgi:hypothetical protein
MTVHRALGIVEGIEYSMKLDPGSILQTRLESYDMVLVDEASMLDYDTFEQMEKSLRLSKTKNSKRALEFGGTSIILVGDLL